MTDIFFNMVITLKFIYLPVIDTYALCLDLTDIAYCLFHCCVNAHYTHEEADMSTVSLLERLCQGVKVSLSELNGVSEIVIGGIKVISVQ